MSLLDLNLENVPELSTVPEGEYTLVCRSAEVKTSQNTGGQYISLRYEIVGEPDALPVYHVVMLPTPEDDDAKRNWRLRQLKRLFESHGCDISQPDPEELVGKEVQAMLVVEEDEYGPQNRIKRFL